MAGLAEVAGGAKAGGGAGAGGGGGTGEAMLPAPTVGYADPASDGHRPDEVTQASLAQPPLASSQAPGGSTALPGQQTYSGPGGYPGTQGYSGAQGYPAPQGYSAGQGYPVAAGGPGAQAPGIPWRAAQPQPVGPGGAGPGGGMLSQGAGAAADQWYRPPACPAAEQRPRWLVPAGARRDRCRGGGAGPHAGRSSRPRHRRLRRALRRRAASTRAPAAEHVADREADADRGESAAAAVPGRRLPDRRRTWN